jgi:hypothetical protein
MARQDMSAMGLAAVKSVLPLLTLMKDPSAVVHSTHLEQ